MTTFAIRAQPRPVSRALRWNTPVAKRSGWVSAKRELRSSRKATVYGEKEDVLRTGMQIKICPQNYQLSSANYQLT